jgi:hypothetical protein
MCILVFSLQTRKLFLHPFIQFAQDFATPIAIPHLSQHFGKYTANWNFRVYELNTITNVKIDHKSKEKINKTKSFKNTIEYTQK